MFAINIEKLKKLKTLVLSVICRKFGHENKKNFQRITITRNIKNLL